MKLDKSNYFSPEAAMSYWSVSSFKEFNKCEAAGLAEVRGQYQREETDALLIGSYVDAYFSDEMEAFQERNGERMFTKKGELYAKFKDANTMINAIECQPLMMRMLEGDKQVVMSAVLDGIPWKAKLDVFNGERIVDLKTVKDFGDMWDETIGSRRSWIEYWGYDIQGAIYQRVVEQATGKKLPFYIAAVTKERVPDVAVIEIPQHILDAAYNLVQAKIERFDLIKSGEVEPIRCEKCEYCKTTKVLLQPEVYEIEEAQG
jgi:hypothetical protein